MIFDLLTHIAKEIHRLNPIFTDFKFVYTDFSHKALFDFNRNGFTEKVNGITDDKGNYGYIRMNRFGPSYEEDPNTNHKIAVCNTNKTSQEYIVNIPARIITGTWNIEQDIVEYRMRQTLSQLDFSQFNPEAYKKQINIMPIRANLFTHWVLEEELGEYNQNKKMIEHLKFFSMDIIIAYLYRYDKCNEIDLCNLKCQN